MQRNWAAEHLHVIRTLMERSAIYRRALMPVMLLLGIMGVVAAIAGWFAGIEQPGRFGIFWIVVGVVAISGAFIMVRRQALRDGEAFWSPPTRRVTQAFVPPLLVGAVTSLISLSDSDCSARHVWWLLVAWMSLYGCALHAGGFFMPRGIKLFGWCFIISGCGLALALAAARELPLLRFAHWVMGGSFGGLHLAYGIYLSFTENRKNET